MTDFLLSFELDEEGQMMTLHGDEEGLRSLCQTINKLINNTKDGHFNHDHLMTPAWGGYELSEENMGGKVVNHIKVYCWKGKECQK